MTVQESMTRPSRAKLRIEEFLLLEQSGAFDAYKKTELINGTVYVVNSAYSQHFIVQNLLYRRLADACDRLATGIEAWSEGSIRLPPHDVPQPDIFVTSVRPAEGLVAGETVLLVIEVASSTLDVDMGRKLKLYAAAGIADYWVVDTKGRNIHQMWAVERNAYRERREVAFGQSIEAETIAGLAVATANL